MGKITLNLDDELLARVQRAAASSGQSVDGWLSHLVHERVRDGWPTEVVALAGAWPDLPTAEQLRTPRTDPDVPRES
ncbi:MAG: CopG family transcriptional regulator [Myxococcota bacterium]